MERNRVIEATQDNCAWSLRQRVVLFLLALIFSTATAATAGEEGITSDRRAIAKDCYSLLQYVRWPNYRTEGTVEAPFVVSVLGDTALVRVLQETKSVASINGRSIEIAAYESLPDTLLPQVLILAGGDSQGTVEQLQNKMVLTIFVSDGPAQSGAILTLSAGKTAPDFSLHVTVDQGAAEKSGLSLSPRLNHLESLQDK